MSELTPEQMQILKRKGYRVGQYEAVITPDDDPFPSVQTDKTPAPDGSDYISFPAVFKPDGGAVCPFDDNREPLPLAEQWVKAWNHSGRHYKYKGRGNV